MSTTNARTSILKAVRRTPLMSASAAKLLEITSSPDYGLKDVLGIVSCDAGLTSHVLKVVNCAAFALEAPVNSIVRAVSLVGTDMVVGIAVCGATSELLNRQLNGYAAEDGDLWHHNLRTAIAAKKIAGFARTEVRGDVAFTSGLLHDIGKAVISDFLRDTPKAIVEALDQGKVKDYLQAEHLLLGMDHCEVGLALAQHWQLPELLSSAIRFHHDPAAAPEVTKPLVYCVHLGDLVAMMGGCGTGADSMRHRLDGQYPSHVALSCDDLARLVLEVDEEYKKVEQSLREGWL